MNVNCLTKTRQRHVLSVQTSFLVDTAFTFLAIADLSRDGHRTLVEPMRAIPWKMREEKVGERDTEGKKEAHYIKEEYRLEIKKISVESEPLP